MIEANSRVNNKMKIIGIIGMQYLHQNMKKVLFFYLTLLPLLLFLVKTLLHSQFLDLLHLFLLSLA